MAEMIDYALDFGSVRRAPSKEAVRLQMAAEALRSRAQRDLLLRGREPWPGAQSDTGDSDEPEDCDCRDEMQ